MPNHSAMVTQPFLLPIGRKWAANTKQGHMIPAY
jgi:hypothetical protein